jgi:hypothetical protein
MAFHMQNYYKQDYFVLPGENGSIDPKAIVNLTIRLIREGLAEDVVAKDWYQEGPRKGVLRLRLYIRNENLPNSVRISSGICNFAKDLGVVIETEVEFRNRIPFATT